MQYIVVALILYFIIQSLSSDSKDRKRWPYIMKMEDYYKKNGIHAGPAYKKLRKRARKDQAFAKKLDLMEAGYRKAHYDGQPQREMEEQMKDMKRTMDDMERELQYRRYR